MYQGIQGAQVGHDSAVLITQAQTKFIDSVVYMATWSCFHTEASFVVQMSKLNTFVELIFKGCVSYGDSCGADVQRSGKDFVGTLRMMMRTKGLHVTCSNTGKRYVCYSSRTGCSNT